MPGSLQNPCVIGNGIMVNSLPVKSYLNLVKPGEVS